VEPIYERVAGEHGVAEPVPIPVSPKTAEILTLWLLTAPEYHPAWSQYLLTAVRLTDDLPGFSPPVRTVEGSTHEIMVYAIDPGAGEQTPDSIGPRFLTTDVPLLQPVNVVEQFVATDDEIRAVLSLCAQAVVHGVMSPDSDYRAMWRPSIEQTLAHMRCEPHDG
jgi:hypothetical protein